MPWNLLILPLLGGFVGLDWCLFTRLRNQRIDGYRLLLEAAFVGVPLVGASYLFNQFVLANTPILGPWITRMWTGVIPENLPYAGTAILAFVLGPVLAIATNRIVNSEFAKHYAIRKVGNSLLILLYDAAMRGETVRLVLSNGSVYDAQVLASPDLKPETHVVLLPIMRGFEDGNKQIVFVDKQAWWTYPDLRWAELIVPVDQIDKARKIETPGQI